MHFHFDYSTKWTVTVLLPAIFGGVLLSIFRCHGNEIHQANVWLCKQRNKIHKPWQQACCNICIGVLLVSFTHKAALDAFNCNPVDPDDGYLYTEFTSKDCEAGLPLQRS